MSSSTENYLKIKSKIEKSLLKAGRQSGDAQILVVSKERSPEQILELQQQGTSCFGENYVQEWREKKDLLKKNNIHWHFIGRLQSNKLKYLVGQIELYHSLDRWDLALKMNDISKKNSLISQVLIEVDLAHEENKTGVSEEELTDFVQKMNTLSHLQLKGFMLFPPPSEDPENSRPYYRRLREILFEFNQKNVYKEKLRELSMGMSNDYCVAGEEGATWLRIGRALWL